MEHRKINLFISKVFVVIIFTLSILIMCKHSSNFKEKFHKYVFEKNISFATINKYYTKYFGSQIPFKKIFEKKIEPVFNEKLEYIESNIYKDGVALTVSKNYMVPVINSGIVVFIGNKDEYGNTVIIKDDNGIEIWYSNIENVSVKMYDYINSKSFLGNTIDDKLYLVFKKDGNNLDYKDFI